MDGPIGTQPGRVILGDIVDSDLVIDLLEGRTGKNHEIIFVKPNRYWFQVQDYLKKYQRKRAGDGAAKNRNDQDCGWGLCSPHLSKLSAHQVDWNVSWPNVIMAIERPDLVKVSDLIMNQESMVHASRLRPFNIPRTYQREDGVLGCNRLG